MGTWHKVKNLRRDARVSLSMLGHEKNVASASFGDRLFPSQGLRVEQLLQAIKECGLEPMVV